MKRIISKIKETLSKKDIDPEDMEEEYVELDTISSESREKIMVRIYSLEDFSDVKPIIDSLREGFTIALINMRPLKEKDIVELKRAINKIKKTCDAINGHVAGFSDDYLIATPSFAEIHKTINVKDNEQ